MSETQQPYAGEKECEPTMRLRWKRVVRFETEVMRQSEKVLQQLWRCADGSVEWRDIEVEEG